MKTNDWLLLFKSLGTSGMGGSRGLNNINRNLYLSLLSPVLASFSGRQSLSGGKNVTGSSRLYLLSAKESPCLNEILHGSPRGKADC